MLFPVEIRYLDGKQAGTHDTKLNVHTVLLNGRVADMVSAYEIVLIERV